MELLLNLSWVALALILLRNAVRRRSILVIAATVCALAFLFPIISASDDVAKSTVGSDLMVAVLTTVICGLALVVVSPLMAEVRTQHAHVPVTYSDPRSPPSL